MPATECEFDIGGFCLRGKRWGSDSGLPVLALHGWLDNCASFDFLAPLLPQLNLVCLDLAGHGLSDHRNHRGAYNVWQDVGEIFAVADQLGWRQFGLLGHSRGAAIAMLAAGTFPDRVSHLGLVEGICPQVDAEQDAPDNLAKSITNINQLCQRSGRTYTSFEAAVSARENGICALSRTDALALAQRGVADNGEGFVWLHDPKVAAASEVRLTLVQIEAFVARISARILLVEAEDGLVVEFQELTNWLQQHPEIPRVSVPGHHHCHMSEQAASIANQLNSFLW